jgi:ribosomal protein S18 acetylase RimI-like enzyme
MISIVCANREEQFVAAKNLFKEYAVWLNIDLCFQNFEDELLQIATMYQKPDGALFLLKENNAYIGCVALRKKEANAAELKRMWIQPNQQGKGYGTQLLTYAIAHAEQLGYSSILLDTLAHMKPAIALYKKFGFNEISPYYHNPMSTAMYFEKKLGHSTT